MGLSAEAELKMVTLMGGQDAKEQDISQASMIKNDRSIRLALE